METSLLKFYTLNYSQSKTYLLALLFIAGNIVLPQLCHLIPGGGLRFLPIYFFTLVGAYKYGWKLGLLTAVLSPLTNHFLFGMPMIQVLPAILVKSSLLAICAGLAAYYFKRISIPILILTVLSYQTAGTLIEWLLSGDLSLALQDFRIGVPGLFLQVIVGFLVIKGLNK